MGALRYRKIGRTSFHVETIKGLTLKQFKKSYEIVLGADADLDSIYESITGKTGKPANGSGLEKK